MDIEKIFALIDRAEASLFDTIEIQTQDFRISLKRQPCIPSAQPAAISIETPEAEKTPEPSAENTVFTPISGVFYARKNPEADPYVLVGSCVEKGQPLCIIEAMKTMNEICAHKSGVIERIFVADAESVKAGDALFAIKGEG